MRAVKRMQNPSIWHELAGWASASFILLGPGAEEVKRLAAQNDYLRIDIPGPGPAEGAGYDWVRVEKIEQYIDSTDEREWTGMKLRPCGSPTSSSAGTAHFFTSDASSTYIIERNGEKVTAFYHGRNEVPNTSTGKWTDNVRNTFVAAGAIVGLSEAQWSALCKGFFFGRGNLREAASFSGIATSLLYFLIVNNLACIYLLTYSGRERI